MNPFDIFYILSNGKGSFFSDERFFPFLKMIFHSGMRNMIYECEFLNLLMWELFLNFCSTKFEEFFRLSIANHVISLHYRHLRVGKSLSRINKKINLGIYPRSLLTMRIFSSRIAAFRRECLKLTSLWEVADEKLFRTMMSSHSLTYILSSSFNLSIIASCHADGENEIDIVKPFRAISFAFFRGLIFPLRVRSKRSGWGGKILKSIFSSNAIWFGKQTRSNFSPPKQIRMMNNIYGFIFDALPLILCFHMLLLWHTNKIIFVACKTLTVSSLCFKNKQASPLPQSLNLFIKILSITIAVFWAKATASTDFFFFVHDANST